jgi:hypothetical protein
MYKVGSSTLRQLFISSLGVGNASQLHVHNLDLLKSVGIKKLKTYNKEERDFRLQNYTKFTLVRHPFDRLVSAFNVKFNGRNRTDFTQRFRKLIHQHSGTDIVSDFSLFLELIVEEPTLFKDVHWRDYMSFCNPCVIQYDHVMYMETLAHDIDPLLNHLTGPNGIKPRLPYRYHERPSDNKFPEVFNFFRNISSETVSKLLDMYGDDFNVFGYTWNKTTGAGCSDCVC